MERRNFLSQSILGTTAMLSLSTFLKSTAETKVQDEKMPALFIGHGSPMNAIDDNEFHRSWFDLGKKLPKPKAILCISAHWLTKGTKVTAMEHPRTIHDFGGFPEALFAAQYPVDGSPSYAEETRKLVTTTKIENDFDWGLDHGTWSVLLPMYPKADIPVFQLSIDYTQSPQYHYNLAKELKKLRSKGVLIIGSGNIVHNLGMLDFSGKTYDWAIEFDEKIKALLLKKEHASIVNYHVLGKAAQYAVPSNDHYLPLLYAIALQDEKEELTFFNEQTQMGSVSMRSLIIS
jgi:4,5-DOPA dioxygenase extradiol